MYQDGVYLIYPPRAIESRHGGQYVLLLFLIYLFFNDSCRTNYLKSSGPIFAKFSRLVELWL